LVQITRDQSLVNQLIEAGQLTEEEAETFEHNNIILQALGTAETVQVDLTYAEIAKGDILLLCSDGLSGMVRNDEMREILSSGEEPIEMCKILIDKANQAGGHDNITVIVAHFDGAGFRDASAFSEPLKYRKYALPEQEHDETEPISVSDMAEKTVPLSSMRAPNRDAGGAGAGSNPANSNVSYVDDRIEIPGTSIPAWLIVLLVLGVVSITLASAWVLLR
jgi:PPM family protein phosphatase